MAAKKKAKNEPLTLRAKVRIFDELSEFATELPHGLKVVFWPVEYQRKRKFVTRGRFIMLTNTPRKNHVLFEVDGVLRKECGRMMQRLSFRLVGEVLGKDTSFQSITFTKAFLTLKNAGNSLTNG